MQTRRFRAAWLWLLVFAIGSGSNWVGNAQVPSREILEQVAVYPSLIAYNAKIYTMDKNLSTYEAMAIRGNRIWRLGTSSEIRQLAGPQTVLVDAKGRTILPGLIDAHTHSHLWGMWHLGYQYDPQLKWLYVEGKTIQEVKSRLGEAVKSRIQQAGPDKWIVAPIPYVLASEAIPGELTRADLDQIAPDTPLAVMGGLNISVTNTKAKQIMERDLGAEVGGLRVWYLLYDLALRGKTEQAAEMISKEMADNVPLGVTTIMTHIESPQVLQSANYLDRHHKMPIRWAWVHRIAFSVGKNPEQFYSRLGDFVGQGSEYFWNVGIGNEGWDNVVCTSAVPLTERLREAKRRAAVTACQITPGTPGYEGHLEAARNGLRLANLHAHSDRAVVALAQIADTVIREGRMTLEQIKEQKWGLDHARMIHPDLPALAAKYGFWMSFQLKTIPQEADALRDYGPEYVSWVSNAKAWADAGARFTLNTDMRIALSQTPEEKMEEDFVGKSLWGVVPDEFRNTIWPHVAVWITREIGGKVYSPQNKLDRTTVMKAWTNWPAEYVLRENDLGSLEAGKLADFIVIDKDYFTIPEQEISHIKTLLTVLDGQVRFKAPSF